MLLGAIERHPAIALLDFTHVRFQDEYGVETKCGNLELFAQLVARNVFITHLFFSHDTSGQSEDCSQELYDHVERELYTNRRIDEHLKDKLRSALPHDNPVVVGPDEADGVFRTENLKVCRVVPVEINFSQTRFADVRTRISSELAQASVHVVF